jgi:hypothetical protein
MIKAKRCGARTRAGTPCKGLAMMNGRCRLHGGRSLRGIAHPNYKHGRRSKYGFARPPTSSWRCGPTG